jgi:hypothetical protein
MMLQSPPGVNSVSGVEIPECVDPTLVQHFLEVSSLFRSAAWKLMTIGSLMKIYSFIGGVEIST